MKILILLLFPLIVSGQQNKDCPTVLLEKEFVKKENVIELKAKNIFLIDAAEECVKTKFHFISNQRQFSYININKINMMIAYANVEVMTKMKNKYSYIPKRIDFTFSEEINKWIVAIDYLAQNDYGGTVNNIAKVQFTTSGEFFDTDFK